MQNDSPVNSTNSDQENQTQRLLLQLLMQQLSSMKSTSSERIDHRMNAGRTESAKDNVVEMVDTRAVKHEVNQQQRNHATDTSEERLSSHGQSTIKPSLRHLDTAPSSENSSIKIEHQSMPRTDEKSCCICFQKLDDSTDAFRMHLISHLEKYQGKSICPQCYVDCGRYEKMVDHFLMVHGGVEKLVCHHSNCVRSFRTRRTLELHARKHMG